MNFADAVSGAQTAAGIVAKIVGGPQAAAFSDILLGKASFVA